MAQPNIRLRERYALPIANLSEYTATTKAVMDLLKGEQLSGDPWTRAAKLGALVCFAVACVLLGASLLTPHPQRTAGESWLTTGSAADTR